MNQTQLYITRRDAVLQFIALWGMAVAQPVYDVLSKQPEFFVVRRTSGLELTAFTIGLSFFVPILLAAVMLVFRPSFPRAAKFYWGCCLFLLQGLLVILILKAMGVSGWQQLLVAAPLASACLTFLYFKFRAFRTYVSILAAAGFLFPLYFLGAPQMRGLLWDAKAGKIVMAAPARPAPVVMVVFDELPLTSLLKAPGEIDGEHFPNFADLAKHANWYPNTWSVSADTVAAVPAILTGNFPVAGKLPRFKDYQQNLFLLMGNQFNMRVQEIVTNLCPAEICATQPKDVSRRTRSLLSDVVIVYAHRVVPVSFSDTLPAINSSWGNFAATAEDSEGNDTEAAERPVDSFEKFVQDFKNLPGGEVPTFSFLHVLLPHPPWRYFPSGRSYSSPSGSVQIGGFSTDDLWKEDEQSVAQAYLRHMLQLRYTDLLLGQLLQELRRLDLFDKSLLVIVADHGASFRAGGNRRAPTLANLVDVLQVPLFVKLPGQSAGVVDTSLAQTIDILPTIADSLGLRLPWNVDGNSLLQKASVAPANIRYVAADKLTIIDHNIKDLDLNEALLKKFQTIEGYFPRISKAWDSSAEQPKLTQQVSAGGSCVAWIEAPEAYATVSSQQKRLPALLRGQLECSKLSPGPHELVVSMNGTYAGRKILPFLPGEPQKFSVLLDEALFKPGHNEIKLDIESGEGRRRSPVRLNADPPLQLTRNGSGQESLKFPDRSQIALTSKDIQGYLDIAKVTIDGAALEGWALDSVARKRVDQIAVFCNNRLLTTVPTLVSRPDVASVFGGGDVTLSGFQVAISLDSCGGDAPQRLRLFGIGKNKATELQYGQALRDLKEVKFGAS